MFCKDSPSLTAKVWKACPSLNVGVCERGRDGSGFEPGFSMILQSYGLCLGMHNIYFTDADTCARSTSSSRIKVFPKILQYVMNSDHWLCCP
eukprot:478907-Amphidinium_carterae.1